ncbi:MAG TPA: CoA-acylating methylmalonate-semialdehyde dehydrogenase, partial [Polyangiaceae bacterium]|nr:CoA-acylating methylmalonate-semialdehyde dehydrogenase [Polyangiaceae bacterium]
RLAASTTEDVHAVVQAAAKAAPAWRERPMRERAQLLGRLRVLLAERADAVAHSAALESGKTEAEARAGLERGLEVVDFAMSLPAAELGGALDVSRGVRCEVRREPLGVVVGITPFNFPAMVPLWMMPIAVCTGNTFILKPSDKVPMTANLLGHMAVEAGFPPGVFSIAHGDQHTVEALIDHPVVQAIAFVGSTPVARSVYARAAAQGKRALCLGGAKNHLIVAPDADPVLTVRAVYDSFTGCAGQRCMAGSVLVTIGEAGDLVQGIIDLASRCRLGKSMGALIDSAARERILGAIERAQAEGARVLFDGRRMVPPEHYRDGYWLGPTILDGVKPGTESATRELFGPVLSIVRVDTLEEALALEQQSPYGNATSIFTQSGAVARRVAEQATSGMIGVNVGVPVPRDPFSFGGSKQSKFGQGDITGTSAVEFWTERKKVTSKWALQNDQSWIS